MGDLKPFRILSITYCAGAMLGSTALTTASTVDTAASTAGAAAGSTIATNASAAGAFADKVPYIDYNAVLHPNKKLWLAELFSSCAATSFSFASICSNTLFLLIN